MTDTTVTRNYKCNLKDILFGFLLVFALLPSITLAQDLVVTPSETIVISGNANDEQAIAAGQLINKSKSKKVYEWYRVKQNVPECWKITTCVPGKCFAADKNKGFFSLAPDEPGIFDQNFFPMKTAGNASVEVFVYEKGHKDNVLKVTFKANISE